MSSGFSKITRLKLRGTHLDSLEKLFLDGNVVGLRPLCVARHTSLYSDEDLLDFYVMLFDEMDAPKPKLRGFFHVNAYTLNVPKPFNLRYALVNWYGGAVSSVNNDGSFAPTLLRLSGYLT